MKKIIIPLVLSTILVVIALGIYFADSNKRILGGIASNYVLVGTSEDNPAYLATSTDPLTKTIRLGSDVSNVEMNLQFQASTTDTVLQWRYEFSSDGTNWYGQDNITQSTSVFTHQAATTTHKWTPGKTDVMNKHISITKSQYAWEGALNAEWMRIKFFRDTNKSGGAIYAETTIKSN